MFRRSLLAFSVLLAGCAADTANYPSLARRDAERVSGTATPAPADAPPSPAPPPSPELTGRLTQLVGQARAADASFRERESRARSLAQAARGAARGSEAWASASIAMAELESARSEAMIALADLDTMHAAAVVEGGDTAAIAAARESVIALVGGQDRVLAELRGLVAG